MPLGKELLKQYIDLQEEVRDLRRRIKKLENAIARMQEEGTVLDTVNGTRKDGTIGSIRIEGFPVIKYNDKLWQMCKYKEQLRCAEEKAGNLICEVEEFISSIADSQMRRIIRYRYIDKLSWGAVADRMGGGNTEDGVRMAVTRFLEKK